MDLIEVRCTNCGARIRDVRPDQRVVHCTRHGCGASFVMDQGRQFAQVEEREAEEIRKLRAALEASLEPFSQAAQIYAERIMELIPGDFRATGAYAVCQLKKGNIVPLRQLLQKRRACTEEEFREVFELVLRHAGVRELLYLEGALDEYVENEAQKKEMRRRVVQVREEKRRLEDVYADVPRDVFLCYSTAQQETADLVVKELEADGNSCWISSRNLVPEAPDYWEEIERALRRCRMILVLCSFESMYSPDVKRELQLAEDAGLRRLELKLDDTKHTTLFQHFFDGITWIAVKDGMQTALQLLKERVFRELYGPAKADGAQHQDKRRQEPNGEPEIKGDPRVERGFICLRDGDFVQADTIFETVLNSDPHDPDAYLGKLLAQLQLKRPEDLATVDTILQENVNFQHAVEFGDAQMRTRLTDLAHNAEQNVKVRLWNQIEQFCSSKKDALYGLNAIQKKRSDALDKQRTSLEKELEQTEEDLASLQNRGVYLDGYRFVSAILILWCIVAIVVLRSSSGMDDLFITASTLSLIPCGIICYRLLKKSSAIKRQEIGYREERIKTQTDRRRALSERLRGIKEKAKEVKDNIVENERSATEYSTQAFIYRDRLKEITYPELAALEEEILEYCKPEE